MEELGKVGQIEELDPRNEVALVSVDGRTVWCPVPCLLDIVDVPSLSVGTAVAVLRDCIRLTKGYQEWWDEMFAKGEHRTHGKEKGRPASASRSETGKGKEQARRGLRFESGARAWPSEQETLSHKLTEEQLEELCGMCGLLVHVKLEIRAAIADLGGADNRVILPMELFELLVPEEEKVLMSSLKSELRFPSLWRPFPSLFLFWL